MILYSKFFDKYNVNMLGSALKVKSMQACLHACMYADQLEGLCIANFVHACTTFTMIVQIHDVDHECVKITYTEFSFTT